MKIHSISLTTPPNQLDSTLQALLNTLLFCRTLTAIIPTEANADGITFAKVQDEDLDAKVQAKVVALSKGNSPVSFTVLFYANASSWFNKTDCFEEWTFHVGFGVNSLREALLKIAEKADGDVPSLREGSYAWDVKEESDTWSSLIRRMVK